MDLSLDYWERLSETEQEALARRLAKGLPGGFSFQGLQTFELGGLSRRIAIFSGAGAEFAFVPGGEATIGFDAASWTPSAEEAESWKRLTEDLDLPADPAEYVAKVVLRPRMKEFVPLLVERTRRELCWEPLPVDNPRVRKLLSENRGACLVASHSGEGVVRVRCGDAPDDVAAHRAVLRTHVEQAAEFHRDGFRLPTSDEWERLCGGGSSRLFRWGDHVLVDRYPTDVSPAEAAWRRARVLSGGTLAVPEEGFAADWNEHRRPNAFGLSIASNPYEWELVQEPEIRRGGDGGCAVCGGVGYFLGWLPLATAYFEGEMSLRPDDGVIDPEFEFARRVMPL